MMVRVRVAIDERNVLVYMVQYKTKRKTKVVNQIQIPKKVVYWANIGKIKNK